MSEMQYMAYFVWIPFHKFTHFIIIMVENNGVFKYFCPLGVFQLSDEYFLFSSYLNWPALFG